MSIAKIEPLKMIQYEFKQSNYKNVMKCPFRLITLAPSGSGKTYLIANIILNLYKNKFKDIFIFSPSIHLDSTWESTKNYIENDLTINYKSKQNYFFDNFDDVALTEIIKTQTEIIKYYKENNIIKLPQILIVIDDFADDESIRYNQNLNSLFTRGRHAGINCIISSQKYHSIANIIRINASDIITFKLFNKRDLETLIDGVSALVEKKQTLLKMYDLSVNDEPFSFLYIKLNSRDKSNMFFIRFEKKLIIKE